MRNEDDKNLNAKDNLDELMKVATQKVDENSSSPNNNNNNKEKSTKKVITFTIVGLLLFGAILTVGAIMLKKPQDFEDKTETPDWVGQQKDVNDGDDNFDPFEFEHPIERKEWANEPYDKNIFWEQEGIEDEILSVSKEDYSNFYFSVSWMNSGLDHDYKDKDIVGPYTNDLSQRYLDDGEENPEFSYALTEDYEKAYVVYMERLLNPLFGNWSESQISPNGEREIKDERQFNVLKDMFSEEWWNENIKEDEDYTNLPILAEWQIGEWDKYNLADRELEIHGVFYGQVKETEDNTITAENIGVDEENQAIMKVNSPVEYIALDKNGKEIKITGNLELTLESNQTNIDVINRIIISDAKLTLD